MAKTYCPKCGASTVWSERRPDGNSRCEQGHEYQSKNALKKKPKTKEMTMGMTEQQVLAHLNQQIPQSVVFELRGRLGGGLGGRLGGLIGGGIGQKIIDALKGLVGSVDVETAVAAAKKYYDQFTASNNPSIPDFIESLIESWGWMAIERIIRRLFAAPVPTPVPGPGVPSPGVPMP